MNMPTVNNMHHKLPISCIGIIWEYYLGSKQLFSQTDQSEYRKKEYTKKCALIFRDKVTRLKKIRENAF